MNRDDIIRWAHLAGLGTALTHDGEQRVWIEGADWHDELKRFAALVAAAAKAEEREACAAICDGYGMPDGTSSTAEALAKAIRGRGQA
jgi:hypothetical protein